MTDTIDYSVPTAEPTAPPPDTAAAQPAAPHQVLEGPDGSELLEYRMSPGDHDLGVAAVMNLARAAGHTVIGLPDRVADTDGATHWRVQVAGKAD